MNHYLYRKGFSIARRCFTTNLNHSLDFSVSDQFLGSIDIGTGSTRFIVFDSTGKKIISENEDLTQYFPNPERHEQNPEEYVEKSLSCIDAVIKKSKIPKSQFRGIGITNQRETVIAWNKATGKPLHHSIIWDDSRTHEICKEMSKLNIDFQAKTGLTISTYFSASKIKWLIKHVPAVKEALLNNNCLFGTVESWMIYNLTHEKRHVTDISNASRTLLMNLQGFWDEEILNALKVPLNSLPEIVTCSEIYGHMARGALEGVPISGSLGDQQAALLGHKCIDPGSTKNTYGTGAFLLMSTGNSIIQSKSGLLTTVFGKFSKEQPIYYALEGSVENAGSVIKWAINKLHLCNSHEEFESQASLVNDTEGVIFVPSFSGLFAPHWRPDARGIITGLTQHTTRAHILRAILEGICFRTREVVDSLASDAGVKLERLSVDGGMTKNSLFLEMQANILGMKLVVPAERDLTALGTTYAAGIGCGLYKGLEDIKKIPKQPQHTVGFSWDDEKRNKRMEEWRKAIPKTFIN